MASPFGKVVCEEVVGVDAILACYPVLVQLRTAETDEAAYCAQVSVTGSAKKEILAQRVEQSTQPQSLRPNESCALPGYQLACQTP